MRQQTLKAIFSVPDKRIWGSKAWSYLHSYIYKTKSQTLKDVNQLISSIPCGECKTNALQYMNTHPPNLESSRSFKIWVWEFHNVVNKRLGKKIVPYIE